MGERELHSAAAAAAAGDRRRAEELFEEIWPMLVRYCRARAGSRSGGWEFADGLARLAGVQIPLRYGRVEASRPFREFVYAVADRTMRDAQPTTGDALNALAHSERTVLILRVIEGLSVGETAAALGLPDARVRLMQHRAMRSLGAQVA
ncbi:sigma factor-like helix-turn-helix DNA-binding protein [Antrihabitans cavernicola]|nr:sigma factor-like helix-turn-helix DNA-binding protein [Spelaeibacter cavernicola]